MNVWRSCLAMGLMMSPALAHEGHGDPHHATGVMHYVVNPSHAAGVVIAAIALATGIRALIRLAGRRKIAVPAEHRQRGE